MKEKLLDNLKELEIIKEKLISKFLTKTELFISFFLLICLFFSYIKPVAIFTLVGYSLSFLYFALDTKERNINTLNKEQIIYFYKPLLLIWGEKVLSKKMSGENNSDREMGDIDLVIALYNLATDEIEDLEKKVGEEKRLFEIRSIFDEKEVK